MSICTLLDGLVMMDYTGFLLRMTIKVYFLENFGGKWGGLGSVSVVVFFSR